jgi:ParB family chromosome partitioning protein
LDWEYNPRSKIDEEYLRILIKSIEELGQRKPILVRPHPRQPDKYQGLDGRTRVEALKRLGRGTVLAYVEPLSLLDACILALRENLEEGHGKPLDPLDEAQYIKRLIDEFHLTQAAVAEKLGCSQSEVSRRLSILTKLIPEAQAAVAEKLLNPDVAGRMASMPEDVQEMVLEKIKALGEATERGQRRILEEAKILMESGSLAESEAVQLQPTPEPIFTESPLLLEKVEAKEEKPRVAVPWVDASQPIPCLKCGEKVILQHRTVDGKHEHRLAYILGEVVHGHGEYDE